MRFTIDSAIYCRLASVIHHFEDTTSQELRETLSCVRIEHNAGRSFAIATNQQIASIEYLGQTDEPDGAVHLAIPAENVKNHYMIEVITIPEIKLATAKTMLGYVHPGNAAIWPENHIMCEWREWGPAGRINQKGAMLWTARQIAALANSSPSGKIVFPEQIDASKPVVVRDYLNPNWVGLFFPKPRPSEPDVIPAKLPDWWQ